MGIIFIHFLIKVLLKLIKPLFKKLWPKKCNSPRLPPNGNRIFTLALSQVLEGLQKQESSSKQPMLLNTDSTKKVNPCRKTAFQDRFKDAVFDSLLADKTIVSASYNRLQRLYKRKPLFDEACSVKDMEQIAGSLKCLTEKCKMGGREMYFLREADTHPLILSETDSLADGKPLKPYDSKLADGIRLGGQDTRSVVGSTLLEIGSDIAGSILLPSMLNNVAGHFSSNNNKNCQKILQSGLMSIGTDLPQILEVMSSGNSRLLKLHDKIDIKRIKAKLF